MEGLKNRLHAARAGKLEAVGKTQKPLTEMGLEWARVKKELAEVKLVRDLQKMRGRFAKEAR